MLKNLDILLTTQAGWLGIKTGWTGAAGGCLLFADRKAYETGQAVVVWGAVLGQPPSSAADPAHPELGEAFASARNAVVAAIASYASVDLASAPPQVSGSVTAAWGPDSVVQVSNHASVVVFVRAGAQLQLHLTVLSPRVPIASGTTIAEVKGLLNGKLAITWQVVTTSAIASPSLSWKLFSG